MLPIGQLDPNDKSPLFRQLHAQMKGMIESGVLLKGSRLPATRELASQIGLNRTTVSAAYALLESEGLITGHVGRGSFVAGDSTGSFEPVSPSAPASFSRSRPSELLFPLEEFRKTCAEVIASDDAASILQLGSPAGYPSLRRYLLEQARVEGTAQESDDILITSGCQQAFDLLQRTIGQGSTVLIEDPVYLGVRSVFERAGARLVGVAVGPDGIDLEALERIIARERPRLLCVTPNFQNPTGATMPLGRRQALLGITQAAGVMVIENDIYGPLCYEGEPLASIKHLDETGDTILLAQFFESCVSGIARRLGDCAALADRETDGGQAVERSAHRSALAGRAAAFRRIGAAGGASAAHADSWTRAFAGGAGSVRKIYAGGRAIHAAARRNEFVDPIAGVTGCGRIAAARRTRRRDVFARQVFRGVAAATERSADQFCRDDAGGNSFGHGDFGPDISERTEARSRARAAGGKLLALV